MKTGDNNGLKGRNVILTCKGSLKVDILGFDTRKPQSTGTQAPLFLFNSPNLWLFFLINVISSPIQQLKLQLSYPYSSRKQE